MHLSTPHPAGSPARFSRRAVLLTLASGALAACGSVAAPDESQTAKLTSSTPGFTRIPYGSDPSQFGDLVLPDGSASSLPVVVLVHGGGWEAGFTLDQFVPHTKDLIARGVAVWNIEYRALGDGGGWPSTFEDVSAAVDALAGAGQQAANNRLDLSRVHAVGHSAGGHLATWLAGRSHMPWDAPGFAPGVPIQSVVALAPVLDLEAFATSTTMPNLVDLMGGSPADEPQRYALGSPIRTLPLGIPVTCVHGDADATVPVWQSVEYVDAAKAVGDPATLHVLPGFDHDAVADVGGDGWAVVRDAVSTWL